MDEEVTAQNHIT